jgi:UDP-glucose:(heptosyl)LPS alpha-1,3-glucosyltransferase
VAGGRGLGPYLRLARRCGAGDAVTFLGPVADPVPFYAAADVYAHPTWYDPCSLVVLEAASSGLPVITSRFNGAGELLTEGVEGFVLDDPGDVALLADRLRRVLDPDAQHAMGHAARRLARRHTHQRNVREIVEVYARCAGRRRAA